MCLIASGGYTGTPDCHLVFINAIYGTILKCLYTVIPMVEWYTILFCIFHIFSMTTLAYIFYKSSNYDDILKCIMLLLMYIIWAKLIVHLQFTSIAGFLALTGCVCLLQENKKFLWLGTFFLLLGSLIRFQSAGLVSLVLLPLFVHKMFKNKKLLWMYIAVACLCIGAKFTNRFFYLSPEWEEYSTYNKYRGIIVDNPNVLAYTQNLTYNSFTYEDWSLFISSLGDPNIINSQIIEEKAREIRVYSWKSINQVLKRFYDYVTHDRVLILLLAWIFFITLISFKFRKDKYLIFAIWLSILLLFAATIYILIIGDLRIRILNILYIILVFYAIYATSNIDKTIHKMFVFAFVAMIIYKIGKGINYYSTINNERSIVFEKYCKPIIEGSALPILISSYQISPELVSPINISSFYSNKLVGLGWLTAFPNNYIDNHLDFATKEIPILLLRDDMTLVNKLVDSIHRNYNITCVHETIVLNEKYMLIKLTYEHPIQ